MSSGWSSPSVSSTHQAFDTFGAFSTNKARPQYRAPTKGYKRPAFGQIIKPIALPMRHSTFAPAPVGSAATSIGTNGEEENPTTANPANRYKIAPNFHGINATKLTRFGIGAGMFGGVAGIALIFFAADVPKVRKDIMQKIPIIGDYWIREIPPEDDPF